MSINVINSSVSFVVHILLLYMYGLNSIYGHVDTINSEKLQLSVPIGVVLDMNSSLGTMMKMCMDMAISDFYSSHSNYQTRLQLHTKDAKSVLDVNSAVFDLVRYEEVVAILGPQGSTQGAYAAEIGETVMVPIVSFTARTSTLSHKQTYYSVRTAVDDAVQAEVLAAVCQKFGWRQVVILYEDTEYGTQFLSHAIKALQDSGIRLTYMISIKKTPHSWKWASIVVATLIVRSIHLPFLIDQLKSTSKLYLLNPQLEAITEEMQNKGMSPSVVAEGQAKMKALYKEHGVSPFTPWKGPLISAPIFLSFFYSVRNMAEKIPSFKEGGTLWFVDLTTPDSLYVFPVLTALTFWSLVECNEKEGMEGDPSAVIMKNVCRVLAVVTVPLTAIFPKAIFCYWITSNLFSLLYGLVIRKPEVKKYLGIPIIPVTDKKPDLSFLESLKKCMGVGITKKEK